MWTTYSIVSPRRVINMKKFAIIFWFLALSTSAQNNASDSEARQRIFRTYGYCYSQQISAEQIKNEFPALNIAMLEAEAAFNVTFGKSCKAVAELFNHGVRQEMNKKINELFPHSIITEMIARDFITRIQSRAKGDIESPVKETLLTFNPDFIISPGLEFVRGFTRKYSTLGHPKAKGLHLEIKVPMSWVSREGRRPNIVQFFEAKYGGEDPAMIVMVRDFPAPVGGRVTQKDIDSLFSIDQLKDFIPDEATLLESKPIVWEGQKGGMWVYEMSGDRLDIKVIMRTMQYLTIYNNRMISLQFSTGGLPEKRKDWVAEFEKNRPLFNLIANSLVIMDKYKN